MMKLNNYKSERLTVGLFFRILRESGLWNGQICTDLFSHGVIQILRKDITPGIECIENTHFMRQTTAARSVAFQVKIVPEFSHESYYDLIKRDLQQGYEAFGIEGIMAQFLNRKVEVRAFSFSEKMNKEGGACVAKFAFPYWDLETPEQLSAAGRLGYFLYVDFTNSSNYCNVLTDAVLYSKLEAFTSKTAFCEEMMHDQKIKQYREKYKEMEDRMADKFGEECLVRAYGQPQQGMFQTKSDRESAIHGIIRGDVLDIEEQSFKTADYRRRLSDPGKMNELINDFREMTWNSVDILNRKYSIKWVSMTNSYTS